VHFYLSKHLRIRGSRVRIYAAVKIPSDLEELAMALTDQPLAARYFLELPSGEVLFLS
jgi:hypothetical protein